MMDLGFYNMDCMQGMKEFPDKYFDLAIVDPPYGISVTARHVVKDQSKLVGGGGRPFGGRHTKRETHVPDGGGG